MPDIPSNILKPVKFGGLDPTSVTTYIDELFSKMSELEKENEELRSGAGAQESQLVQEYKRDLEAAQRKAAEAEKAVQGSAAQVKAANDKAIQLAAALKAEKEGRASDAQKMKQLLQQAQAKTSAVDEGKMREYQQEIVSLKGEISQLTMENTQLKTSANASGELSASVDQLQGELDKVRADLAKAEEARDSAETALKDAESEKEKSVSELNAQKSELEGKVAELEAKVSELEEKASESTLFAPEMDMAALYADAQKNANQLVFKAKAKADETVKNAEEKAKKTIADAEEKAEKTVADANAEAEKIIKDANDRAANANDEADAIINKANEEAAAERERCKKETAEQEAKIRQLTSTVHSMLSIEIEGVEKSIKEAGDLMAQAAQTMERRLGSANSIIAEAKESVDETAKVTDDKMDAIMSGTAVPETVVPAAPKAAATSDNFADSMLDDFASMPDPEEKFSKPAKNQPTPMPKAPKVAAFSMSDLVKEAEANVSDN